jgi:hypothetical protein
MFAIKGLTQGPERLSREMKVKFGFIQKNTKPRGKQYES